MPNEEKQNQNQSVAGKYNKNCTLLVPRLFNLSPLDDEIAEYQRSQFKDLELFLARAKHIRQEKRACESVLFDLFDISFPREQDLPIAPVTYLGDTGISESNWCLRADPVHLIPDRDELVLSGPETLSLTMLEAEHLAAELNSLFLEDGWRIEVASPTRWYLHLLDKPQIRTWSLLQVNGQSIGHFLPEGPQAKQWHRLMNEVQMILHGSEVNRNRQANGRLTVSSLWFWGAGQLPDFSHSHWSQVWSDEVLSKGLAKLTRTPCSSLPENARVWLSEVRAPGEHLLIYPELNKQAQFSDLAKWQATLTDFQQQWLTPLIAALKAGEIEQLTVNTCDGQSFRLTGARLKRWWIRPKALHHYLRHDHENAQPESG
jgi:hypothetical protein